MKKLPVDLLFHPDTFFRNITKENANLVLPVIIVSAGCAISVAGIAVPLIFLSYIPPFSPAESHHFGLTVFVWYLIRCYLLPPFLGWGLVSGTMFLISRLFTKTGSFFAILQNTGYGLLPWVISTVIVAGAKLALTSETGYYPNLFLVPSNFVAIVFYASLLWCCYLWVFAIKHTCRLPLSRATAVVVIMILVFALAVYIPAYFPTVF